MSGNSPARVFVEGRYRKLTRDLPQTKFYCPQCKGKGCNACEGFGKLTRDSVQELLAWVAMPRFKARRNKFHGAGREDMDVRMLGEGRPFVFEVLRAKVPQIDLEDLAAEVNRRNEGRLEIVGLRYSSKSRVVELKEMLCAKEYRALVDCDANYAAIEAKLAELQASGRTTLVQKTPQRVVHRRADLDRERWIDLLEFLPATEGEAGKFWITIRSQHGTYIKEAISGDDGRCHPSFSELLDTACHCVALDVLAILEPEVDSAAEA
ncbi:MAG: tRNA pseudouridine(54/55) synthase Pus10 [Planctomycetes bacterium]|nr:tRNA pseudouridine(54/55) synthase Pus10 [Planctomycetota bacterium]